MDVKKYYEQVAEYFNVDASDFEERYEENPVLKQIRQSFRSYTEKNPFKNALEIGCGPGIDLSYFGQKYPSSQIFGIDIAPGMVEIARQKISRQKLSNVTVATGTVEDIGSLFPGQLFDLIYVYFGALNTVYDLQKTAQDLHKCCTTDSTLILSFVNRHYVMDVPLFLMKGQVKKAFSRFTGRWKGYSLDKSLDSRCYSAADIQNAFSDNFKFIDRRGYSIFYPAWYRYNHLNRLGKKWGDRLWQWDKVINRTPFWNCGEYSLYILQPK